MRHIQLVTRLPTTKHAQWQASHKTYVQTVTTGLPTAKHVPSVTRLPTTRHLFSDNMADNHKTCTVSDKVANHKTCTISDKADNHKTHKQTVTTRLTTTRHINRQWQQGWLPQDACTETRLSTVRHVKNEAVNKKHHYHCHITFFFNANITKAVHRICPLPSMMSLWWMFWVMSDDRRQWSRSLTSASTLACRDASLSTSTYWSTLALRLELETRCKKTHKIMISKFHLTLSQNSVISILTKIHSDLPQHDDPRTSVLAISLGLPG